MSRTGGRLGCPPCPDLAQMTMPVSRINMLAGPLAAGLVSALVFMAPAAGSLFGALLQVLTPLPLYHIAVSKGLLGAAIALFAGLATVSLALPPVGSLGLYLGLFGLPVLAAAWRFDAEGRRLEGAGLGRVVAMLAYGLAVVAVAAAVIIDRLYANDGGVAAISRDLVTGLADAMSVPGVAADQAAKQRAAFLAMAPMLPLAMTGVFLLLHLLNALAALSLGRMRDLAASTPAWSSLWLPRWLVVPALVATGLAFAGGSLGLYAGIAAAALATTMMLQGLAVIHVKSSGMRLRPFLLTGSYFLVFLADGARLFAAALGAADHWFDFRKQTAPPRGKEKK